MASEKSFHDYLMAVEIPDYFSPRPLFMTNTGATTNTTSEFVNRLVAVKDDSKCWRLGLKKQTKPQLNFDKEEWDRIEQKLPDWFGEILANEDEVVWHEAAEESATRSVWLLLGFFIATRTSRARRLGGCSIREEVAIQS